MENNLFGALFKLRHICIETFKHYRKVELLREPFKDPMSHRKIRNREVSIDNYISQISENLEKAKGFILEAETALQKAHDSDPIEQLGEERSQ